MATQLEIVNKLLVRLRENQVSTTQDNPYATLIAQIVADSYQELLDEWNWDSLNKECAIAVPSGTSRLPVTAVVYGTLPTADMMLTRLNGESYAVWVTGDTYTPGEIQGQPTSEVDVADLRRYVQVNGLVPAEYPMSFAVTIDTDNDLIQLEFSQEPSQDLVFVTQFTKRTSTMQSDGTTDDQIIDVPVRALEALAFMYALNERGEEMGEPGNLAERRYINALSAAKEKDIKAKEHGNRMDWRRD